MSKREELGLTQEQLADKSFLSRMYIQRLEQGLLSRVPSVVLNVLFDNSHDKQRAVADYELWQVYTRNNNADKLREAIKDWNGDWVVLRLAVADSKVGFCKLFCIHPQVLDTFEKKLSERTKLTPYLRQVLSDGGFTALEIVELESRMAEFNNNGIEE